MEKNEDEVLISIDVTEEQKRKIEEAAAKEGITVEELLNKAIAKNLEESEHRKKVINKIDDILEIADDISDPDRKEKVINLLNKLKDIYYK